ncbi:hypothetical protein J1605_003817 [Eschrichtius robustus]|uniref:Uncharacterized protein n=1 Tax=Eschrichtius robustus TaxID=9764 RepID=A0AB34HQI7_ESCRO|nr:hypothetical protein J1605_003817 [Eschrichtius robustus]
MTLAFSDLTFQLWLFGEWRDLQLSLTVSLTSLCPQALLLLGLHSISASLQDQHCESVSLAGNISGEHPHLPPARFQVPTPPPPPNPQGSQSLRTEPSMPWGRNSREISPLGLQAIHHLSTECCVEEDPEVGCECGGKESCD